MAAYTPSGPAVSFGGYVKPETVQELPEADAVAMPFVSAKRRSEDAGARTAPKPLMARLDPMLVSAGLIGTFTFFLGIMAALHFAKDTPVQMAEVMPQPVQPEKAAPSAPEADVSDVLASVVAASLEQGVTRNVPGDLITPAGAMSQADPNALSLTEILLGLSPQRATLDQAKAEQQEIFSRDKLQMLRESVLAGNFAVKTVKRNGVERLCLRVPKGNVTQDEAADLIRRAAERGEIELPAALGTADGSYDADTLIFNLVQTSLASDGTEEGKRAAQEMSRRAFVASAAKTKKVKGGRVYLVKPGDSLAYISLQFYGQPSRYMEIFRANRGLLKSPDKIQIGQRLIIPT